MTCRTKDFPPEPIIVSDDYLAGIFDGEGCVYGTITKAGACHVVVALTMCDPQPVWAFHYRFGGTYRADDRANLKRVCYSVRFECAESVEVLEFLAEYCIVKRDVAAMALELARRMREGMGKGKNVLSSAEKEERVRIIYRIRAKVGRSMPDETAVENYLKDKSRGNKTVRNSIGETFPSQHAAAAAYGVWHTAISYAINNNKLCKGLRWERVS